MDCSASNRRSTTESASRKSSGRLRAYAVEAAPRRTRKAVKFRCRNCSQKVLVETTLSRSAITCPTCQELIPAPQRTRLYLEVGGGILVFVAGVMIGHGWLQKSTLPPPLASALIAPKHGEEISRPVPAPNWLQAAQAGD